MNVAGRMRHRPRSDAAQVKVRLSVFSPVRALILVLLSTPSAPAVAYSAARYPYLKMHSLDPQSALAAAISILLTRSSLTIISFLHISLITLAFHRLYFHPLSHFPGPLLARLTPFPDLYHAYRGDKHIHFLNLHATYGAVVRFSPNSLAINDPAALKAIYGHGANVQKSPGFYHGFRAPPAAISTLLATEKTHHARKRRIMGQAFSEQAMRDLEKYVLENVRVFERGIGEVVGGCGSGEKEWSEGVDMGRRNNWLVFGE